MEDYVQKVANDGNPDGLNIHEIDILANKWAMIQVRKEQKHLKAYLKGLKYYKLYGKTYPVLTNELLEENEKLDFTKKVNEEEE